VARPKPDPEVFLRAASLLGAAPGNCVVFEDSLTGVEAARAAGALVVAVRTTRAAFPDVDLVIDNFLSQELELWLGSTAIRR
jgi:beta-phosphoglucomutase-like phosphatase (HAD superfamily)